MLLVLSRVREPIPQVSAQRLAEALYLLVMVFAFLGVVSWGTRIYNLDNLAVRSREQLEAAHKLKLSGVAAISSAFRFYEPFPLLTGLPVNPCPQPNQAIVVNNWAQIGTQRKARSLFRAACDAIIFENEDALLCHPRWDPHSWENRNVADYGPKFLKVGEIPNRQPDGSGAIWFRLSSPVPIVHRAPLVLLTAGQISGLITWATDGTWFSAPFNTALSRQPGTLELSLWDPCTGGVKPIGIIEVR
jgi:hypothetical protein